MDPRWQPTLDHPPSATESTPETRHLLAAGWRPQLDEGWLVRGGARLLVAPQTWRALRELVANVPVRVCVQAR